jgi:outer membrane protein assembly factor BamB
MNTRNPIPLILCLLALTHALSPAAELTATDVLTATGTGGGLAVHVGCGQGKLVAELGRHPSFTVFGLDRDARHVAAAREQLGAAGLYGKATVDQLVGNGLPLIDNVVNLLVLGPGHGIAPAEIQRILTPGGVAWDGNAKTVKAVPEETDEWTHYLHGPDNNAVSEDEVVSYPYHTQWAGYPVWTRNHNHLNGYSAVVTSAGRIFYIFDDGPIQSVTYAPRWRLVARDAYNGVVLWKRDIRDWEGHLRPFRSGPVEITRRLVASGERLYVTMGYGAPVSVLDAATGETVRTLDGTEGTHEILFSEGILYLVAGNAMPEPDEDTLSRWKASPPPREKRIQAMSPTTGTRLWETADEHTSEMLATTLCMDETRLFFQSPDNLVCLAKDSGRTLWKTARPVIKNRKSWSSATVVVRDGVVLCADGSFGPEKAKKKGDAGKAPGKGPQRISTGALNWTVTPSPDSAPGGELIAFQAEDGKELWRCPAAFGYCAPPNLFVADGLVWVSSQPGINVADMTEGRDLQTGEVKRKLDTARAFDAAHHHRCYRDKATNRFLLLGRTGVEWVDLRNNDIQRHFWIRGSCQYGLMPANGLLYLPGHSCGCYIQSKLNGFWALAPKRTGDPAQPETGTDPLTRGPAYDTGLGKPNGAAAWPMHRHGLARAGATEIAVPKDLAPSWSVDLGGDLTAPVAALGKLIVSRKDTHTVTALAVADGRAMWSFRAGGVVDSPPSISRERVVFGAHDGYVYCLTLKGGEVAWRFRAAPRDRRAMTFGHLESLWPVVGSVSIVSNTVYCVAGRSSYLDGGISMVRLDLESGKELGRVKLYSRDPQTGEQPDALLEDVELPGFLPDILVVQDDSLFLRDRQFTMDLKEKTARYAPHLYSSGGLLDPHWWHRTAWIWGGRAWGRASGWAIAGKYNPSGRLLVLDDTKVYGYKFSEHGGSGGGHSLFCSDKKVKKVDQKLENNNAAIVKYVTPDKVVYHWKTRIPFGVRGMVRAGNTLFAAGPGNARETHFDDSKGTPVLAAFNCADGKLLSRIEIPSQPVFDGMAAVNRRLFMSLVNGRVVCYSGK